MTGASPPRLAVRRLARVSDADVEALAALMIDVVEGGASIGFMLPIDAARAEAFWRRVGAGVDRGDRVLFVADAGDADTDTDTDTDTIVGTVQLLVEQPENQPHRADIAKMMVSNRARRQGIGAALMRAAEQEAKARGKTLLVLDTASADAERLYARLGWQRCGTIPGYALLPQGGPCDTTYFYRVLDTGE
jgi:GNAT superfamily N-acetyltransferase